MSSGSSRVQRVIKTFREACAPIEAGFGYISAASIKRRSFGSESWGWDFSKNLPVNIKPNNAKFNYVSILVELMEYF